MEEERRKKERRKLETCRMCGKKLPAKDMFRRMGNENRVIYFCCQICYELFTGKPLSGQADMEYK